jgi:hypothetical protein
MKIIQSPKQNKQYPTLYRLFLAGGISGCPNWQADLCERFKTTEGGECVTIFNPRRKGDLAKDSNAARDQILWEHHHLMEARQLLFWFPEETLCPITLFELGKYVQYYSRLYNTATTTPADHLFIGIHPNYQRRFDLEIQLPLMVPDIKIHYSLDDLFNAVCERYELHVKS